MSADSNLPAARETETGLTTATAVESALGQADTRARHQPLGVAFLPLALATLVIIAFVLTAWTFLAAAP